MIVVTKVLMSFQPASDPNITLTMLSALMDRPNTSSRQRLSSRKRPHSNKTWLASLCVPFAGFAGYPWLKLRYKSSCAFRSTASATKSSRGTMLAMTSAESSETVLNAQ
ncbi:hypothetical protein AWZ03_014668 [Drosophila navojoa]|uniref:Uncharacterized protein n=1 Tax=Drosophila navojoa TaxID=7232 RepID=A0A484ASR5_DRONA|nr:hypothetical protein AWZ03_014668 [Drosophila navojoa]